MNTNKIIKAGFIRGLEKQAIFGNIIDWWQKSPRSTQWGLSGSGVGAGLGGLVGGAAGLISGKPLKGAAIGAGLGGLGGGYLGYKSAPGKQYSEYSKLFKQTMPNYHPLVDRSEKTRLEDMTDRYYQLGDKYKSIKSKHPMLDKKDPVYSELFEEAEALKRAYKEQKEFLANRKGKR